MSRSALTVAAFALVLASAVPATAGETANGWAIDRGDNAANVQVRLAPGAEDRSAAAGCECTPTPSGSEYVFPSASGVTVIIAAGSGYGPFLAPYGATGYSPYVFAGSGMSPRVLVWASPGGGTF